MTSIGTIRLPNKTTKLIFSDGMGSGAYTKYDNHQKLFRIGDNLISGTGNASHIVGIVETLRDKRGFTGNVRELADAVNDQVNQINFEPNSGIGFVIAGVGKEPNFQVTKSNYDGSISSYNGKARDVHVDGSGRQFTGAYLRGLHTSGRTSSSPINLEEALVLVRKLGIEGTEDRGVNDKLQIGVINDQTVTRIYHPDVYIASEVGKKWSTELFGFEVTKGMRDEEYYTSDHFEFLTGIDFVNATMYKNIMHDLDIANAAHFNHIRTTDLHAQGKLSAEDLQRQLEKRQAAYKNVKLVSEIFTNPGIQTIRSYNNKKVKQLQKMQNEFLKLRESSGELIEYIDWPVE